jgi:hypothetical protein
MCDNHIDPIVETRRKARKAHTCWECDLPIPVGTHYIYTSGIDESGPCSFKQHVECHELLQEHALDDDGCWIMGTLREWATQVAPDHPLAVGLKTVEAKYAPAA